MRRAADARPWRRLPALAVPGAQVYEAVEGAELFDCRGLTGSDR